MQEETLFQNEFMKVTDENDYLKIWNYTGPNKEKYYNFRGYITDNNNNLICPSFGHTEEILSNDTDKLNELNIKDYQWFYSTEGTLCRVFHYKDQWYISTHKKLSAFESRWSCKFSFGELFINSLRVLFNYEGDDIFDWFCNQLNKDEIYYFLLRCNSQNRIICNVANMKDNEKCVYIGRLSNKKYYLNCQENQPLLLNEFSKPMEIQLDKDTIVSKIDQIDPFVYQGLIGFFLNNNNESIHVIKLLNSEYKNWMNVRGNNPNLRFYCVVVV